MADGILRSTVRGLLAPRRAIPIALVVVPLTIIQDAYSRDPFAVPVALALCASFLLVAPSLWRALFPMDREPAMPAVVRAAAYAFVGVVVVALFGRVIPTAVGAGKTFLTTTPSLGVCVALFWVGGWGLAREAEHAQLLALKSHLDPHFLFNTLNAIAEWCREDAVVAEKAIVQLSSMLRTMMGGIHTADWPLAKEIELVLEVFALHAIRDPSAFTVEKDLPDPLPAIDVPAMLLLPLAENAMKHGPLARNKGPVRLSVSNGGGRVTISLSNPGVYAGRRDGGNGLPIVEKRLALAYGEKAKFEMRAEPGNRCTAVVVIG